ncbi:MAG: hypothetical protein EON98_16150 [Chitinophagaceae bacterium]|nr:MAG: hypothetical protein EON98_16150 [Chitinophagaceae bacterium]
MKLLPHYPLAVLKEIVPNAAFNRLRNIRQWVILDPDKYSTDDFVSGLLLLSRELIELCQPGSENQNQQSSGAYQSGL